MIVLFTDFGAGGPYLGQVKAVLYGAAPTIPVIDLMADAPAHDPMSAAYLLAAYVSEFPHGTVFLAVVDPGVGSGRRAVAAEIDGRWYVAPDNGLLEPLLRRAKVARAWEIAWRPERLSASFHGRDLFAPIAARLARAEHVLGLSPGSPVSVHES
ncbi:MAG: S-adenosyl-l-methionine hydroxide adenosyltransferase family protein [Stellaceae bacterium]